MEKKNLFFDFDGMKFDTMPAQVEYINQRYGINTTLSDHIGQNHHFDVLIKKHLPNSNFTRDEVYTDFGKNFGASIEWHKKVLPMPDMDKVIPLLAKKYTLWTVTARQSHTINTIEYLLDKYIPGCISGIHCVYTRLKTGGFTSISKKDFMRSVVGEKIGFFDDSPSEIEDTKNLIPSFLFDPVGSHEKINGAIHLSSWKEIGDIFL